MLHNRIKAIAILSMLSVALCASAQVLNSKENIFKPNTKKSFIDEDISSVSSDKRDEIIVGTAETEPKNDNPNITDDCLQVGFGKMEVMSIPNISETSEALENVEIIEESTEKEHIEEETKQQEEPNNKEIICGNRWDITLTLEEIDLLARIVWAEARGECEEGQEAVVEVIFNRMVSNEFPDNLTLVLSQNGQFSTWEIRNNATNYDKQIDIVNRVLAGKTNVLDIDVLYFAMSPLGNDIVKHIGCHYFTR